MNGWAKFFLLLVCCVFTLILFPQYDQAGLKFMGMLFLFWTCTIMLFSIIGNILALYKFETLNRLFGIAFLAGFIASLLLYFPLVGNETPYTRLQNKQWPTEENIKEGVKRLTFNFDFVRRNAKRQENFVNQKIQDAKTLKKQAEALDIIVSPAEDQKENKK
ncbi:hypothetical protein [Candidatus Avelusimicrobium sp.]